jgi:hypothetical protein
MTAHQKEQTPTESRLRTAGQFPLAVFQNFRSPVSLKQKTPLGFASRVKLKCSFSFEQFAYSAGVLTTSARFLSHCSPLTRGFLLPGTGGQPKGGKDTPGGGSWWNLTLVLKLRPTKERKRIIMGQDHSSAGSEYAQFDKTRWTMVLEAVQSRPPGAPEALAELCGRYWRPLYGFARRRGRSPEDAQDSEPLLDAPHETERPSRSW